eukprot:PITA_29489
MKCLSYNCRGLASAPKKLALKRLIETKSIDIIMLQETLCSADQISKTFQALTPGWSFISLDVAGRSGGLAIGTNPHSIRVDATWGGTGYLGLNFFSADLGMELRVVNVYGPCNHRELFWQRVLHLSLIKGDKTIIGGDLNFSLGFRESWGSTAQVDSITDYMTNLLEQTNFVDIPMQKLLPTWRNRRVGDAALARRLDRFIMKDLLLHQLHHYKQWVISDYWLAHPINGGESLARGFCKNLLEIKHLSINWAKEKHARDTAHLTHIESELSALTDEQGLGFISAEDKGRLIELENQKAYILKEREESLRLRSRAIWLQIGDEKSKFFHSYAKGRKVSNTIWQLPTPEGDMVDSFNKLAHLGITHFRGLYKSPQESNLPDIINIARHFPRFVEEDDAEELNAPVTSGELEGILKWFKKDKSPGPDGWTIEFYLAFYDILGQDLLKVVEESRISGSLYHQYS